MARNRRQFDAVSPARLRHPRTGEEVEQDRKQGHERVFRVQMNTLEWLPIFLPSLWLFAIYVGDQVAAAIGLLWIVGRIVYMIGYTQATERRSPGFFIQALACAILLFGAFGTIAWRLVHA